MFQTPAVPADGYISLWSVFQTPAVPADGYISLCFRHPLFPLMALLFEKCEQASLSTDPATSSDSFDVDIQAFVHHQELERKPFFSDDADLNSLVGTGWGLFYYYPPSTSDNPDLNSLVGTGWGLFYYYPPPGALDEALLQ